MKTITLTTTLAIAMLGLAAVPSQAATRMMDSSLEGFQYRCEVHGGIFAMDGSSVSCQTPTVPVACDFYAERLATCNWPGIENQIAVIRVIGTLPGGVGASTSSSTAGVAVPDGQGGGGGGGGNWQGPQDFQDAPKEDPKPNWQGPQDIKLP